MAVAHGGGDPRAAQPGELQGDMAGSPGAGVDQDVLAGRHLGTVVERLPRGDGEQRHGRRFDETNALRDRGELALGHHGPLGVGAGVPADAAVAEGDPIALLEAGHRGADALDDACAVVTQDARQMVNVGAKRAEPDVGGVECRRVQANQHVVVGAQHRVGHIARLQDLRPTRAGHDHRLHGTLLLSVPG